MVVRMRFAALLAVGMCAFLASCGENGGGGRSCFTNQDCAAGEQCVGGNCLGKNVEEGCQDDTECAFGEFCDPTDKMCKPEQTMLCTTDANCPPDKRCNTLTGVCIDGNRSCRDDSQCQSIGKRCHPMRQECVDCFAPEHCTAPAMCIDGACTTPGQMSCRQDSECSPPNTVCEFQQCVLGCGQVGSAISCGPGQVCDSQTGRCKAAPSSCVNDTDCGPPTQVCEGSICVLGCAQPGGLTCTGGQVCNAQTGRCGGTGSCVNDSDCGAPARICENNSCVPGCNHGGSCNAGEVCDTNTGRCQMLPGQCMNDAQCNPPNTVCEGGQCVGGCTQVGGLQCSGNTMCNAQTGRCDPGGAVCTSDAQCMPPSTICDTNSGACIPGCGTSGCPAMQMCNAQTGRCQMVTQPGMGALNTTCTTNNDCQSGVCFAFGGAIGSRCISSCGNSTDCPSAYTCYDYFGAKMCVSSQLFSGASFTTPNGGACTMGSQCKSNFCPGARTCVDSCSEDSDCPGSSCLWSEFATNRYMAACNGPAGSTPAGGSCSANNDCRSGVCYGQGTCGDLCGSSADCSANTVCAPVNYSVCTQDLIVTCLAWEVNFVNACVSTASPLGNLPMGSPCTDWTQCRDGFCNSVAGVCTGACSRNADCPSNMRCGVEEFGDLDGQKVYFNACIP